MIGAKTVGPEFAESFRKVGVVVNHRFERSEVGIGLKGLLEKIAKVDHELIMERDGVAVCEGFYIPFTNWLATNVQTFG